MNALKRVTNNNILGLVKDSVVPVLNIAVKVAMLCLIIDWISKFW